MTRHQYISQWKALFTQYVDSTLATITMRMNQPGITLDSKDRLRNLKFLLEGRDVCDVKTDLAQGIVTDDTLDKTERIYAEIGSFFIDISVDGDVEKECIKVLFRQFENYRKQMTKLELNVLR